MISRNVTCYTQVRVRKQNNMSLNTLHVMNRDITSQNTIKHNKITPIKINLCSEKFAELLLMSVFFTFALTWCQVVLCLKFCLLWEVVVFWPWGPPYIWNKNITIKNVSSNTHTHIYKRYKKNLHFVYLASVFLCSRGGGLIAAPTGSRVHVLLFWKTLRKQ